MNKLRIVLALQVLFFFGWGAYLLSSRNSGGPEFYLETEPVDPRDLISGTYVALNYAVSRPQAGSCPRLTSGGQLFVKLEDMGKTVNIPSGPVPVYQAADCAYGSPSGEGWVKAEAFPGFGGVTLRYGIERFFVSENDPRKDARSGSVVARVKIGPGRQLMLLDLVNKI